MGRQVCELGRAPSLATLAIRGGRGGVLVALAVKQLVGDHDVARLAAIVEPTADTHYHNRGGPVAAQPRDRCV